jgi:hypothetical protein
MKSRNLMKNSLVLTAVTLLGVAMSRPANAASLWDFNETSGSTALDSLGTNNGTYQNGLTPTGGIATFDGLNDYIEVPNDPSLNFGTGNLLVSAWIKTTSESLEIIVDKRVEESAPVQGYSFFVQAGVLGFQLADGTGSNFCSVSPDSGCTNYSDNAFVADGKLHQVGVSVDRNPTNGGKFFVDGILTGTFNPTFRLGSLTNSKPLRIGRRSDSSNPGFFTGSLDQVCVAAGTDFSVCDKAAKSVPESTSTLALLALGTFGLGAMAKRKLHKNAEGDSLN